MIERIVQIACDRCTLGVMDADNPHLHGRCRCSCHLERLATGIIDAASLALAVQASGVVIAPCVPRGEAGRRDLVTIGAYCEMAFARNAAERELAIWRETCAVPLVLPSPPSPQRGEGWGEGASEEEFGAEMLEAAER